MSDYTQIVYFAPKDSLITGNPAKKVKGTELDAELAAISTAILSKLDSGDVASNAEAAALASTSKLITPASLLYGIANGNFQTAQGFVTNLPTATPVVGDLLLIRDQSAGELANITITSLAALIVPSVPAADGQTSYFEKTASENVAGSTAFQADDHFVTGSLATGVYLVTCRGGGTFNAGDGGIKVRFGGTATLRADNPRDASGMTLLVRDKNSGFDAAINSAYPTVGCGVTSSGGLTSFSYTVEAKIHVTVAGTLQMEWAQNAAAGTTTISSGYMTVRKIA